jgi:crotonobetainyl-CoA:carnitine CoA-transferase CaiB-like acyl-CoA transferase
VLDLTRVIAGPVCSRYLGALGADVLRLDPPHRPDMAAGAVADTLLAKRSALLDLAIPGGHNRLHELLDGADAVVCGYRPGALERFGLEEDDLAERHPGLVVVYLSAWGHSGPWVQRRGFDSVVQAPTGIALGESLNGDEPGALPCQLLDHGTGYLAAAAVLDSLCRQHHHGGTHIRRLSLARTAWWLTATGTVTEPAHRPRRPEEEPTPWLDSLDSAEGTMTAVMPPGRFDHQRLRWPLAPTGYGSHPPAWRSA